MYEKQLYQMYLSFLYVAFVNTLKLYSRADEKKLAVQKLSSILFI